MPGSDMITLQWTDPANFSSGATIADRFSTAFSVPEADLCQDWTITSQGREGGWSVFGVERALDTGDPQDRPIVPGPNRVVFAWGSGAFGYHGADRGASVVTFFGTDPFAFNNTNVPGVQKQTVVMPAVIVPDQETTYMCYSFTIDPQVTDAHVVEVVPLIETHGTNREFVHHMLLHVCDPEVSGGHWKKYTTPGSCSSPVGDLDSGCTSLMLAWAVGMGPASWPPDAGFRIGNATSFAARHGILEIHYDNAQMQSGVSDSSGVEIYYTDKLRKYDSAVLTLGDPATRLPSLDPGLSPDEPGASRETNCPSECTADWPHDINVFGSFLHMHGLGRRMHTSVWNNDGTFRQYLDRAEFWNFDFQQEAAMSTVISRGDRLQTFGAYSTEGRSEKTTFGEASSKEMLMISSPTTRD
jgi:Copper type II ascorbate-dependent monooxygenase, N-terminal domain/Copper type II ascorbate-dependent monooxygenase, C-terminal domain